MEEGHRELVPFAAQHIKGHKVWALHLVLCYFSEVVCLTHASLSLRSLKFLEYNKVVGETTHNLVGVVVGGSKVVALGPLFPTPHATKCPSIC